MHRSVSQILEKKTRRHIFGVFHKQLPRMIMPIWLCFIFLDYLYQPEQWSRWVILRLLPIIPWLSSIYFLRSSVNRKKYSEALAVLSVVVPTSMVTLMVYDTGGVSSLYVTGIVLVVMIGVSLFQMSTRMTNITNIICYGSGILVFWIAKGNTPWVESLIMSLMFGAMVILNFITKSVESSSEDIWAHAQMDAFRNYERAKRLEILSVHFPPEIRRKIEANEVEVGRVEFIDECVVGFADIAGSTEIANLVSLQEDWAIKENFINMAKKRAKESGMIVPTHTGDGCLFIANYLRKDSWPVNIISFFENLQRDYDIMKMEFPKAAIFVNTGLRFGIASGPAGIGFLGDDEQSYYTAIGRTVNLASRLTARAGNNEIVVDEKIWSTLEKLLVGWQTESRNYEDLKGFNLSVKAFHIKPRTSAKNVRKCKVCDQPLVIYQTAEGFIDLVCENNHDQSSSPVKIADVA